MNDTTLILPEWIAPVTPGETVLTGHGVVIAGDRIAAVLPRDQALVRYPEAQRVEQPGHVLVPGFINAHSHAAMALMRGSGDDLPLRQWLEDCIWPAEARVAGHDFVADGSLLAAYEMLMGGVTTFNDMYFFPDATAVSARTLGMRAALGLIVIGFPTAWATTPDDYLAKGLALRDRLSDDPMLSFCLAPHAPYTVDDAALRHVAVLADELELPVHIHVHETASEISDSLRQHGLRPLERLDRLGLLTPHLIAVHAVHLDATDIARLAGSAATVAHCPHSNLKLASGIAPIAQLLDAGVPVALGTDGSASNNRLDLLAEARTAALLAKGASGRADCWPASRVLRSMTLEAARALGLDDRIGSIEAGKFADLVSFDLQAIELQPVYDPVAQLIYAAGREHLSDVWIHGRPVVAKRQLVSRPARNALLEVAGRAPLWQNRIRSAP